MRASFAEAVHHTRHRTAFGKKLIDQPLMTRVLADLALDVVGAQALTLRLARSFDRAPGTQEEAAYARIMTPAVKYWSCKLGPALIYECMECLGGNGYVEESNLPRFYREAPLNAIWEGSGNIMCLDVLRAIRKHPEMLQSVLEGFSRDLGETTTQTIDVLRIAADMALEDEGSARIFTEQLALTAVAAAELRRSAARRAGRRLHRVPPGPPLAAHLRNDGFTLRRAGDCRFRLRVRPVSCSHPYKYWWSF